MNQWQKEMERIARRADSQTEARLRSIFQKTLKTLEEEAEHLLTQDKVKFWQLFRASTLQNMQDQVGQILYDNYESVLGESLTYLQLKQQLGWDEAFYETSQRFNADFDRIDLNRAYALATYSEDELADRLSKNLYSNTVQLADRVVDRMESSLLTGLSSQKIAAELVKDVKDVLQKELNSEYNKAIRIVRTENTRIAGQAKQNSLQHAESLGIEIKKQWVSALDNRTRSSHGHLDGQTIGVDEYFEIGGDRALAPGGFSRPENSINCRCTMISVIEDYKPVTRRIGKELTEYKSYQEWKEAS